MYLLLLLLSCRSNCGSVKRSMPDEPVRRLSGELVLKATCIAHCLTRFHNVVYYKWHLYDDNRTTEVMKLDEMVRGGELFNNLSNTGCSTTAKYKVKHSEMGIAFT